MRIIFSIHNGEAKCEHCPIASRGTWLARTFRESIDHLMQHLDADDRIDRNSLVDLMEVMAREGEAIPRDFKYDLKQD